MLLFIYSINFFMSNPSMLPTLVLKLQSKYQCQFAFFYFLISKSLLNLLLCQQTWTLMYKMLHINLIGNRSKKQSYEPY